MSNPLDISLADLRSLAASAGRQASLRAKRAGILPAGLLKENWLLAVAKKRRLSRPVQGRTYITRISKRARTARKTAGKRVA